MKTEKENNNSDKITNWFLTDYNPKIIAKIISYIVIFFCSTFLLLFITLAFTLTSRSFADVWFTTLIYLSLFCIIIDIAVAISLKQIHTAEQNPHNFEHFETSNLVSFETPYKTASIKTGEKVLFALGPVMTASPDGLSIINHETIKHGENTYLFTNKQLIALMIGSNDLNVILNKANSPQRDLVGVINIFSSDSYFNKSSTSSSVFAKIWPEVIDKVLEPSLDIVLKNHLNFGVPYINISRILVKNNKGNPMLLVYLKDGKKLIYYILNRNNLDEIEAFVSNKLKLA